MYESQRTESQEVRILGWLKRGNTITQLEALQMFGCMRLADRVFKLRRKGYPIQMRRIYEDGKMYGLYWLKGESK